MADSAGVGISRMNDIADQDVDSNLLRRAWANSIELESLLQEPLLQNKNLRATVSPGPDPKPLPGKVFTNVTPTGQAAKANRRVTLQFLKSLSGTGRFGDSEALLNNEEQMALKHCSFYANDWAHAVAGESYGIKFRELSATRIFEQIKPLLAQWYGELEGSWIREAIMETRSPNLAKSPLSLAQPLNPNWFFPGLGTSSQPSYDSTAADLENNIGDSMSSVTASNNVLNVRRVLTLADYLEENYIMPLEIAGKSIYLLFCHPDEIRYNLDPSRTDGWSAYWNTGSALQDINQVIQGAVGLIGERILLCRDARCPTATLSGNSADWTITMGYVLPGRTDNRATGRTANTHFNTNYILGANALGVMETEAPHYEEQKDEYNKIYGIGYIGAKGYQLMQWDVDTTSDTSLQSEGTYVVCTSRN